MKKTSNTFIVFFAVATALLSTSILNNAYARPSSLPDKAKIHAAPHRTIEIEHNGLKAIFQLRYTTVDSPDLHKTAIGGSSDGVGLLFLTKGLDTYGCTGTLLTTGRHILTAAHCITDEYGNVNLDSGSILFEDDSSDVEIDIDVDSSSAHPDYDGDFIRGNDIAVLTLSESAPATITRNDISRSGRSPIRVVGDKFGYGLSGKGKIDLSIDFGTKRDGTNRYDAYADLMLTAFTLIPGIDFVSESVMHYDFDDGSPEHDAFGYWFGLLYSNLGEGIDEVNSAPGDSGGPTFKRSKIIGVTSYGLSIIVDDPTVDISDINGVVDSSFGEFSGDTNVAKYSAWIDEVTSGSDGGGSGEVVLEKEKGKRKCSDGIDNDGDGFTDDEDSDC